MESHDTRVGDEIVKTGILNMVLLEVSQHWSPPHYVMGYSFTEWLALLSILTVFIAVVTWFIRVVIVSPLNAQISILSSKIDDMNTDRAKETSAMNEVIAEHTRMLRAHDNQLTRHEEDIKTLFKRGKN